MAKAEKTVLIGSFSFDLEAEALMSDDGTKASLRPQTARVLGMLAAEPGQLVTKDTLMDAVWADTHVTDDSLVQCISEIRKALGPENGKLLVTVPKQGYRLVVSEDGRPGTSSHTGTGDAPRSGLYRVAIVVVALFTILAAVFAINSLNREPASRVPATVAVLPFLNLSDDAGQDYLSVGLAEDLLTDLSRSRDLKILSRSATFSYREVADAAARIHSELGATHLIDGSLQRDGDRIRISVQLVEADTGVSVWAERFDKEVGGLFDLQDEVRGKILNALSVELDLETNSAVGVGTSDVSAYDLLLQGRYLEASLTKSGISRAIDLYKRAVDIDPTYGDAYARLANMYDFSSRFGWGESVEGDRALALELSERAIRFDPSNPFAYWTRARVLSRLDGSEESAEKAFAALETAIELDPDYADAYAFIALLHIGGGNAEAARLAIEAAFDLNPEPPSWYIRNRGIISYFEGDFEASIADFAKATELNPTAHFSRVWLAAALARADRLDDAAWELEEGLALGSPKTIDGILHSNEIIRDPAFRDAYVQGLRAAGVPG